MAKISPFLDGLTVRFSASFANLLLRRVAGLFAVDAGGRLVMALLGMLLIMVTVRPTRCLSGTPSSPPSQQPWRGLWWPRGLAKPRVLQESLASPLSLGCGPTQPVFEAFGHRRGLGHPSRSRVLSG
nr:unnamed protein product [Digitaria exilis]